MPIESCRKDNKPGLRWGTSGACYTYRAGDMRGRQRARQQALRQARAIQAREARDEKQRRQLKESLLGK